MNYCAACFDDAVFFGEIFPLHELILHDGFYKIVKDHDEIIRFHQPPIHDPCRNMTDQQVSQAYEDEKMKAEIDGYFVYAEEFRKTFVFAPQQGHYIVEQCKKGGYDPMEHGWLEYWLIEQATLLIAAKGT